MNKETLQKALSNMSEDKIVELLKTEIQGLNRICKAKNKARDRENNEIVGSSRAKQTTLTANAWNLTEQYQNQLGDIIHITEYMKNNFIYKD